MMPRVNILVKVQKQIKGESVARLQMICLQMLTIQSDWAWASLKRNKYAKVLVYKMCEADRDKTA